MPVTVMACITAVNQPVWACISIWCLILGRTLYALGYCKSGPKGRLIGAIITDIGLLSVLIGGFVSVFTWENSVIVNPVIVPVM